MGKGKQFVVATMKINRREFGWNATELFIIWFLLKDGGGHFVLSVSIHFSLYWIGKWITAAKKSIYAWHVWPCLPTLNSLYCSQQKPTRAPQFEERLRKRNRHIVSSGLCKTDGDYLHFKEKRKKKKRTECQGSGASTSVIYITSPFIIVNNHLAKKVD